MFRFESMWLKDEQCEAVVSEAWERGISMGSQNLFTQCMDECRRSLSSWNKNTFGHVGRKISTLQKRLQWLEGRRDGGVDMEEVEETRAELNRMMAVEEDIHQRNTISCIKDSLDNWQEDEGEIGRTFVEYFENLFTSSQPVVSTKLLEALHTKVTDRMNARLLQTFQASEVEKALKQMHPMKAPGPDDMPPLFYQHFWPTVKSIVIQTVLDFLNHGAAPPKFHETHIVLVPKTKNPDRVTDYRPISLCNVAYKLASKAVANRLKLVLQDIICENQSAFVSERLITDNVLVAHEIMNHISRKRKGKCGEMALKLDMSKAYDRVEWSCLQQIMAKLRFHEEWIRLVMRCVSSVTYAVRVNGHAYGQIVPTRGLRQGDPLSPYLFLICAEGLSALLHKAVRNKELRGIAASVRGPRKSHLFFADDSLIFGRAIVKECLEIQRVLQVYEESSGEQLNRNKTSLYFSHNTADGVKETIKATFGAQVIKQHESYLGLPSLLAGWKEKLLSSAGKEVLIKAVAQAVLSYTMSCFKLPNSLCDELTGMVRQFWWGQVKDEKKLAWMSWEKMCLPKEKGVMGFRDLKLLGSQPSFAWRSIWAAQDVVKRGLRWQVGDGQKSLVWKDKWLQKPSTYRVVTPENTSRQVVRVCDLIDGSRKEWKKDLISQCFLPQDVEAILSIPLSAQGGIDRMIWSETKNGKFTVRSAYKLAQIIQSDGNITESSDPTALKRIWRRLWDMKVPNKIKHFAWKACKNILATKENLQKRSIIKDIICDSCGKASESTCHLFWLCDKAKETWSSSKLVIPFEVSLQWKFMDVMWQLQRWSELYPGLVERAIAVCWGIWKDRNTARHGGKRREGKAIVRSSLRPGLSKVNVDGAIFSNKKQVGIGVIIRDSAGLVIAALSRKLALPLGVLETEAKAMEVGVQFALDVGVRDVTLEGDSLFICNALQGLGEASSSVHNIIARTLHLAKSFRIVVFSHTKRQANVPAHLLAQHATHIENYVAWLEECPTHVEVACNNDVSLYSMNE
ncbi:uncharacterized protein LOC142629188 [Castanea sativa]|uniref:uncharacterized protein LOC142629188 n=1 Tax=Castanea sativa TaxID=21020 RepID=UPI003F64D4B7